VRTKVCVGTLASIVVAGLLVGIAATAAVAQTVTKTFPKVVCTATINGTTLNQSQDVTVSITAPDTVAPGQQFTVTFPGGTSSLPTVGSGLGINDYTNLFQTLQIQGATFDPGTIVNPGTATVIPAASAWKTTTTYATGFYVSSGSAYYVSLQGTNKGHSPATNPTWWQPVPTSVELDASLPAADQISFGEPGPFSPGNQAITNSATLTTPDISVSVTAPASGSITLNMLTLTTTVILGGGPAATVCNVPNDTIITIPVVAGNVPPTVNAGPDASGNVGDNIALTGSVTDPDSTPTIQWTTDGPCTFADATNPVTTISCTKGGVFAATLTANDGSNPAVSDSALVTVVSPNVPPTVNAGPDVSGFVNDDIQLNGSVTDPDSTPTLTWTVDSPNCGFDDPTIETPVINCSVAGTYAATLTADDGINAPVSDVAQVTVNPIPPGLNVTAGPDVSGNVGAAIALNGKVTDTGGTPTVQWSADDPNCSFASPNAAVTTITCTDANVVAATITAHDGVHPDATDTAFVQVVQPNTIPVVNAGPDVIGKIGTAISLSGTVTYTGTPPTIQWTIDGPSCSFANASAPATTVTCSTAGVYAATLTATGTNHVTASDNALVTVVSNVPPVVSAGPDTSGAINTAIALHGTVSDPDSSPSVSWTTASPNCTFANSTAADTTITCTAAGAVAATLTANDGVNAPVSDSAIVTVTAPNTPPTVSAGADATGTVKHPVTLIGSVSDPDSTPTVHWSNGNPNCSFQSPNSVATNFVCTTTGVFAVTLTADDGVNTPVQASALVTFVPGQCTDPCLQIGDASTYEGGVASIPITLSSPQSTDLHFTAKILPIPGGATNGTGLPAGTPYDFKSAVLHNMTIKATKLVAYLNITATIDQVANEGDESFDVELTNLSGAPAVTLGRSIGVGTIKDATGMAPGQILVGSSSIAELNSCATCKATAKVSVVISASATASVKYTTQDAGATAGVDYTAKTGTLTFSAGATVHKELSIITLGDNTPENTEGINIVFSNPVGVSLPSNGHIDILDND